MALAELDALHSTWPETLQCNIVVERAPHLARAHEGARASSEAEPGFHMHVELDLGHRSPRVKAHALGRDLHSALSRAFSELKLGMPIYAALNEPYSDDVEVVAA